MGKAPFLYCNNMFASYLTSMFELFTREIIILFESNNSFVFYVQPKVRSDTLFQMLKLFEGWGSLTLLLILIGTLSRTNIALCKSIMRF